MSGVWVNGDAPVNLFHNTIVNPDGGMTGVTVLTGTVQLTNNIISNFTTGISQTGGTVSETHTLFADVSANTSGAVNTSANSISNGTPAFTDPANDDYTLQAGSDAIDAGTDAGITLDKFDYIRPLGGFDIGAYEWAIRLFLPILVR